MSAPAPARRPDGAAAEPEAPAATGSARSGPGAYLLFLLVLGVAAAILAIADLTQGTSDIGPLDVVAALFGQANDQVGAIVGSNRMPRMLAGLIIGAALGVSGAALQILTRNPLASPDTLAINAGAYVSLTVASVLGVSLGALGGTGLAFLGGLVGAGIAMLLTRGGGDPVRLVLGGTVLAMGLGSITSVLILMNAQATTGLYAWGSGTLAQSSSDPLWRVIPFVLVGTGVLLALSPRLDVLALGDDSARMLGIRIGRLRVGTVLCAVLLAAAAVSVVGPLGFVGLAAPAAVRLLRSRITTLRRSAAFIVAAALAGSMVSLGADVGLRALIGATGAVAVPTGIATSLLGAIVMVIIALRFASRRAGGTVSTLTNSTRAAREHRFWDRRLTVALGIALALAAVAGGVLVGDAQLLLGDVVNWLRGAASGRIELILDSRWPRVAVAAIAGGSLALAGALVQAITRNPLADPGLLGVSAGAGTGAIMALLVIPGWGFGAVVLGALLGAAIAGALVLGLGLRGTSDDSTRLVLVGLGVGTAALSLTSLVIVGSDPWNQTKALTWLAGSTYGASSQRVVLGLVVLVLALVITHPLARTLDVTQLDPTTPRVLGIRPGRLRAGALVIAVLLTASATAIVGVISFVGLVAPHAARMLVGPRHRLLMPLSVALGAFLVVTADAIGRSIIAPNQLPAGATTAILGTPYFLYLLARTGGVRIARRRAR